MADLSGQGRIQKLMSWYINQIIDMVNLAILNNRQNKINIIYDDQIWQTFMTGGIVNINSQG